jgi:hypothetical protein
MIDERLGRHSTTALTVLIPGLLVIAMFVDALVDPGSDHSAAAVYLFLALPSLCVLGVGLLNRDGLVRSLARAVAAGLLLVAWYAILVLPFAAFCTMARGDSCM